MSTELLLLILLVILSGAFSGAEIALTSLTPAKVRTLEESKKFGSKAVVKLKSKPQNLLITILIGNNLVNILATVIATAWGIQVFGNAVLGYVTGILTLVVLIFGEITPKTFAQKYSEGFSRLLAVPLLWLTYLLFPLIWILEQFIHGLMRLLNAHHPISSVSEEELLAMVDIGTEEGVIEEHEQELIANVLEFTETTVEEIMTVKKDIEALTCETNIHDAVHFFIEHSHSRIPVFKGDLNHILGIVTVHDILRIIHKPEEIKALEDIPYSVPVVVPRTKSISELFNEFQRKRQHIAMVVDERGDTIGLVTLEDILEEIVGDIADEQDREEKMIHPIEKNMWEVNGEATIEQINEVLGVNIDYPEHQTIALLVLEKLNRFPKHGEKIEYDNLIIQVTGMSKKKIETVEITRLS